MSGSESLDRVLATVDYLRVTVGAEEHGSDDGWLPCQDLVADPAALADIATATAAGRGTDRIDVALSLFVQGYAFRIASVAIGTWLLDGTVIDVRPERTAIAIGRHRPNALRIDAVHTVADGGEGPDPLGALHRNLVDGHLASLVSAAHRACRIGEALLWSNVGAACASAFGAFMGPRPDLHGEIRDRFRLFLADARPELAGSGRVVPVGPLWAWERSACCLWYRTDAGSRCEDCSLWTDEERTDRYARVLEGLDS